MTELGTYITNEYAILKQIFSYLPSKELIVATNVCKEWREVALRVLIQNNLPQSYVKRQGIGWGQLNDKIHPKVILHFTTSRKFTQKNIDFVALLKNTYCIQCPIYSLMNSWYISSMEVNNKLEIFNESDDNSHALLLLPEMRGVSIDVFSIPGNDIDAMDKAVTLRTKEVVTRSKCFLLFVKNNIQQTHCFINSLKNPEVLVMAGGVSAKMAKFNLSSDCLHRIAENHDAVGIAFSGENVTAHSDIHDLNTDINQFMQEFSKRVGPKPDGSVRIAFMFICVNRIHVFKQSETKTFSKYFPQVPVYGFWSFGEYCIKNPLPEGESSPQRKKLKSSRPESFRSSSTIVPFKFFYEECTSYLVITFKR